MIPPPDSAAMTLDEYDELCAWTLSLGDGDFVHQHVVDARMLQTADEETKPVGVAFALAGLCLYLEHGFSGREVQRAHMKMGAAGGPWPTFEPPVDRGTVTHRAVIAAAPGPERIAAIRTWCLSVWRPWSVHRERVEALLRQYRVIARSP